MRNAVNLSNPFDLTGPSRKASVLAHVRRVVAFSEMALAALYLASNAPSYTTGTRLNVGGGYLLA